MTSTDWTTRTVLALVLVTGCGGGGSGGGTGGSGGTATGGTAGAPVHPGGSSGSTGGAGGAVAGTGGAAPASGGSGGGGSSCWPACIAALQNGCWRPSSGSCTQTTNQGGGYTFCYPNGVTEVTDALNKVHTFANASGTCFIFADTTPPASGTKSYSYKDAAGNEVARATSDDGGLTLSITRTGGASTTLNTTSSACTTVLPNQCTPDATACRAK